MPEIASLRVARNLFFLSLGFMLCSSAVSARWAKFDDMEYSIEDRKWEYWIQSDGTYVEETEQETMILKDAARMNRGLARFNYFPEISKFEVLSAETVNGDKVIPVNPQLIEDKPLASSGEGFDQLHQVLVAFPSVDIGSKVRFKVRKVWNTVPVPGFFSETFYYGYEFQKKGTLVIHSKLPLIPNLNDPDHELVLKRKEKVAGEFPYLLEVRLKAPVLKNVVDEQDAFLDPKKTIYLEVASTKDWTALRAPVMDEYEAIVKSELPPMFKKIADSARSIADPVEKMNRVTSLLADKVRYLGDWRSLKGKWVPRPLKTIASSQFGDCKDFSVTISAILRNLGLDAHPAWVWRSWTPIHEPYELPDFARFNHAISFVKVGDREFWIDGTNVFSYAQGVPGDIAGRPALVLDPRYTGLTQIPSTPAEKFVYSFREKYDFDHKDGVHILGTFHSEGGDVASWIAGNLNTSQDTLNFKVIRAASRTDSFKDWKVEGFKIKSRIVSDLNADFQYVEPAQSYRSTAGLAYPIHTPDAVDRLLFNVDQRISDMVVGELFTYDRDTMFTQISVVGQESLACALDSPWFSIRRDIAQVPEGFQIHDHVKLKKQIIRHSEYSTAEFQDFQKKLVGCFKFSSVIYQPASGAGKFPIR